jgi:S1-C subfamily serine protease
LGIATVVWGSAADIAGLRQGDVILELDGKPVVQETDARPESRLTGLRRAFVQDGRDRVLTINRLGDIRTVTLKMVPLR